MNIWEGIYKHWPDARDVESFYDSNKWVERASDKLNEYIRRRELKILEPLNTSTLPVVASIIKPESILHLGGASGWNYLYLSDVTDISYLRKYTILEREAVCSEFSKAKVFKDTGTVHFENDYTALSGHEFLYVNSVLQYFIDLDELFKIIQKTGAKDILIDDWFVGEFNTFYSLQNAYGYQIPCTFMNQQDAIEKFRSIGYKLKFIIPFYSPILGEFNEIPMQNFPDDLRIKFTKTAFFQCE